MTRIEIRPLGWVLIFSAVCGALYATAGRPGAPEPSADATRSRERARIPGGTNVAIAAPLPPAATAGFRMVAADAPEVQRAIPASDLEGARAHVGQTGAITGTVTRVFTSRSGGIRILNFAADYRQAASVVISRPHLDTFPDLKALEGRQVVVSGPFIAYEGRPEVEVAHPSQILLIRP
jgi:hypothetical protein